MNYYLLEYSENDKDNLPKGENPILLNSYELNGFDLRNLWRGEYIKQFPENIQLYYEKGDILLDYTPNVLSWLIFSNKVIKLFCKINVRGIQYFPIKVFKKKSEKKFYSVNVVNVLEVVSAMDWNKSEYVSWEDDPRYIKFIRKIVLKSDALYRDLDIFRLQESKNYIIVSERVKEEIEKEGLIGFGFIPLKFS